MVGMLDQMISDAICKVEEKFNTKHTELLARLNAIDGRLSKIEATLQTLVNRK